MLKCKIRKKFAQGEANPFGSGDQGKGEFSGEGAGRFYPAYRFGVFGLA
jgi:hypothetical protein